MTSAPYYCFCGAAGAGAGAAGGAGFAGCDVVCVSLTLDRTELVPDRREAKIESVIEVTMKMTADQVVALVRMVEAPRGPKAV